MLWFVTRHLLVNFGGERLNPLADLFDEFRQSRVLLQQHQQLSGLLGGQDLSFRAFGGEGFPMPRIRIRVGLVAIGLPRLREQDQRRRVGGLKTERQVQENEGVEVKFDNPRNIQTDPDHNKKRLRDEEERGAKEAGEGFCLQREPIISESGREMSMRRMEAEMALKLGIRFARSRGGCFKVGRRCLWGSHAGNL